jgi:hypothetical protein
MAKYISKRRELKVNLKSSYTKETEGRTTVVPGIRAEFHDGVYETSDEQTMELLEAHPNFGGEFVKVPDNVKDIVSHRDEWNKDLETRERELAERERKIEEREKRIQANEEGEKMQTPVPEGKEDDGLEAMKRDELVEVAEQEGLDPSQYKVGVKNADIVSAIRAKREEAKQPGENGGGAQF